jgi:glycosyltransferase involved in cell wall biosynthesis
MVMKMHVASIYTLYGRRAGAEMFFEKTAETMARLFPETRWTVFCNREAESVLHQVVPGIQAIHVSMLDNQFKKAFWLEFLAWKKLAALAPDVFWNPSGCNYFPGRWTVPTVTTFLDLGEYRVKGKYDFKRMFFRKRICIPRAVGRSAAFTAISQFTADDMDRFLNVRAGVAVVHCGPATHRPGRVAWAAQRLKELHRLEPQRFFFVPGRTDFIGKGLDLMLDAHDRLGTGWPEGVKLVFVGPQGDGHGRFIARLRKSDQGLGRLFYLGRVAEEILGALYQECLATVLPSRFEGFGFPVLEAMGYGVPVLCSDAGSLPEVAGAAALMFRSGHAGDLAAKLRQMAADAALRARLVERGRAQLARFSWDLCATGMHAAFERAIQRGEAAAISKQLEKQGR